MPESPRVGCRPKPCAPQATPTSASLDRATRKARYNSARRHEQDCWDILVKHTSGCPACRREWLATKRHGGGCAEGRDCRQDWIKSANRKYELSPKKKPEAEP